MRRTSIRFRITALATALVAIGLLASAIALVTLQRSALTAGLDRTLAQRADDLVAQIDSSTLPESLPDSGRENFVQFVDPAGMVVIATPNLRGQPILEIPVSSAGESLQTVGDLPVDDDLFRVLTRRVLGGGLLHVGTTYDSVSESVSALTASMAVVIPVLVVGFAGLIWWMVGRTLQPVEDIRTEVSEIGLTDLNRRVPRPGTEDEIDRLAGTMNEMLERIETSIGKQQRFVADASHELRSPLTRLRTQLEVELRGAGSHPDRQHLEELHHEVLGMQRLIEDLLFLAKSDAGHDSLEMTAVDLDDLLLREGKRLEARGRVAVDFSEVSGANVVGDSTALARAIRNVLENAERHANGSVKLRLNETDNQAVLVVSDDGPGIDPPDAEHIFERFGRLDVSRSAETGGIGLGLAIAREIVELHDGTIGLIQTGGGGATFEMRLRLSS